MLLSHYLTIFFATKSCCIGVFVLVFGNFYLNFRQKSKKICQFFEIFSRCVSMIYEKFEKKVSRNT